MEAKFSLAKYFLANNKSFDQKFQKGILATKRHLE